MLSSDQTLGGVRVCFYLTVWLEWFATLFVVRVTRGGVARTTRATKAGGELTRRLCHSYTPARCVF